MDRDSAVVTAFLRGLAREPQRAALPTAAELYRRARLLNRLFGQPAPVEHAMRRLALADVLGVLVTGGALLLSLAWVDGGLVERISAWSLAVPWLGSEPLTATLLLVAGLGVTLSFAAAVWPLIATVEE
jgi:hypothetical protein